MSNTKIVFPNDNFLRNHLVNKIRSFITKANDILLNDDFYWFDEPIKSKDKEIDRFKTYSFYYKDKVLPKYWTIMTSSELYEFYIKLKNNEFYFNKKLLDGRSYKTRLKKEIRENWNK